MPRRNRPAPSHSRPHLVKVTGKSRLDDLLRENQELRARLTEAEETIQAIQSGEVDGVVVSGPNGSQVYTLAATETERQFHQLADSISNLAWMANADGWLFWYNRRWYEYTGTTPEQMEGWGWQSVHDPNELPKVMKEWTAAIETGEPFAMTFPLRGADGVFRPFLTRGVPLKNDEGKVVRWFGTNTDISEQKEIEEALKRSEAEARAREAEITAILDAVPALTFIAHDPQCRHMTSNRAVYDMLHIPEGGNTSLSAPGGKRPPTFHVEKGGRIVPPEELPVQKAAATGKEVRDSEMTLSFKDGSVREIFGHAVPILGQDGKPQGAVGAFIDITERKRAEKLLMRSEKLAAAGRLAATIAHEINNPLEAVTNLLYLIASESDADRIREYTAVASAELARVSHITRQTLGFYRDSTSPQLIKASELLDEVVGLYRKEFQARKLTCQTDYDTPGEIHGFSGEMRQIFSNLIRNAIDAAPEGGFVRIAVRKSRHAHTNGVSVFICDNGPGILPEHQNRIFEPFFTTKGQKGTGLGLWVARDLVQKHGGFIRARSATKSSRRGTCLYVFLPSKAQPASDRTAAD